MPTTLHVEKHFTGSETVRDVVIGMADGLTVPFALAAGLSAAISSTKMIATTGMVEIVADAIAMGLGGYLAARTDQATSPRNGGNSLRSIILREAQSPRLRPSSPNMVSAMSRYAQSSVHSRLTASAGSSS
jgi:hypothetical protein